MAGDLDELLDMSMFDLEPLSKQEEVLLEETEKEEKVLSNNENKGVENKSADDKSQEEVGNPEKGKTTEKSELKPTEESPATDDTVFKSLSEFLKEQGFFPNLDIEIKSADDLAEAFKKEIQRNEFADLNEKQKKYVEALRIGIPQESVEEYFSTTKVFEDITDEVLEKDSDIRKQVIIQDLLTSGIPQERANKQYQRIYDLGEDIEEAKLSRNNLKQKAEVEFAKLTEQTKLEQEKAIEEQNKEFEKVKQAVYNQSNLFESFKVTDHLKNRVFESMSTVIAYDTNGTPLNKLMKHRSEDPIDFDTKLYYLYELTNGFKNIDKFVTKSTSTATKKLAEAVTNSTLLKQAGDHNYGIKPETRPDIPIEF